MTQTSKQFSNVRATMILQRPFYATIIMALKPVFTDKVWLAGTDYRNLFINPVNFDALKFDEAVGLLMHEAMHIALLHNFRRGPRDRRLWNVAGDFVINNQLVKEKVRIPDGGCVDPKYDGWSTEEVYTYLKANADQVPEPEDNVLEGDLMEPDGPVEEVEAEARELTSKALDVAKACGKLPAGMEALLDDILYPTVNWQEALARFMTDFKPSDYSFGKPNRRFAAGGLYLPGPADNQGSLRLIAVVIDTSGSVSDEDLRYYFGGIADIIESCCPSKVAIVYCDAQVNAVDVMDRPDVDALQPRRVGGGGTDMRRAIDKIEEDFPDATAIVILTDGYTPFPSAETIPLLWAMTTDEVAPVGTTIRMQVEV